MPDTEPNPNLDDISLLIDAEARIDTAIAQLVLTTQGVTDATTAQSAALGELRAARKAIGVLRDKFARSYPKHGP